MKDVTKQLADALEGFVAEFGDKAVNANVRFARSALAAYHSQQSTPCDMGEICLGCEPRREDGGCPGEKALAVPEGWLGIPLSERLDNLMHAAKWDADEVPFKKANLIRDIERCYTAAPQPPQQEERKPKIDVDKLSNFIRAIDGNNKMGAGNLAEKISEWLEYSWIKQS